MKKLLYSLFLIAMFPLMLHGAVQTVTYDPVTGIIVQPKTGIVTTNPISVRGVGAGQTFLYDSTGNLSVGISSPTTLQTNIFLLYPDKATNGFVRWIVTGTTNVQIASSPIAGSDLGLTSKGDILVFDGSALQRLPAGADGYILSANSGNSLGLSWIVNSGGAGNGGTNTPVLNGPNTFTAGNTFLGITNLLNYLQTNTANGSYVLIGTNGHIRRVDQHGTTNVTDTNGVFAIIQTNGSVAAFTNGNLTLTGGTKVSGETNTSLTANTILAAGANKETKSIALSGLTFDGTTLTATGGGGSSTYLPDDSYRMSRLIANGTTSLNGMGFGEAYTLSGTGRSGVAGSLGSGFPPWLGADTSTGANTASGLTANGNYTLDPQKRLYWACHITIPETNNVNTKLGINRGSASSEMGVDTPFGTGCALFRASATAGDTTWKLLCSETGFSSTTNDTNVAITKNHKYLFELSFTNNALYAFIDGVPVATNTTCVPTNVCQSFVCHINTTPTSQTNFIHDIFTRQLW